MRITKHLSDKYGFNSMAGLISDFGRWVDVQMNKDEHSVIGKSFGELFNAYVKEQERAYNTPIKKQEYR